MFLWKFIPDPDPGKACTHRVPLLLSLTYCITKFGLFVYCGLFTNIFNLVFIFTVAFFLAIFFHCCLFVDTPSGCPCLDWETDLSLNQKKWFRLFAMLESVYEKVTSLTPLWAKSPPNFLHTFARLKSWQATSYPISRQFLNDLWGLHTVHLFQFSWNVKKIMCYTCVCKCGFKKTNYNKRGRRHCSM